MGNKFPTKKQTSQSQRMSQTILSPKVSKLSSFFKSWYSIFVEDDSNVFLNNMIRHFLFLRNYGERYHKLQKTLPKTP